MAKGARSKVKKRLRSIKAQHLYQIKGKAQLEDLATKLNDPNYNMKRDHALPPNAFLHPNNPMAVFPQTAKPEILDLRSHKMELGGYAAVGVFRKINSEKAKKSRWSTVAKNAAQLAKEEAGQNAENDEEMSAEEVAEPQPKELTAKELEQMFGSVKIGKTKKATVDVKMDAAPKISVRSRGIKKKKE